MSVVLFSIRSNNFFLFHLCQVYLLIEMKFVAYDCMCAVIFLVSNLIWNNCDCFIRTMKKCVCKELRSMLKL